MRILFSRMSIALTWEDNYIDHVQELYHSETGNLQHTEAVLIVYITSLWSQWEFFNHIREIHTLYSKWPENKGEHLLIVNQNPFGIPKLVGDNLIKYHREKHSTCRVRIYHLKMYFPERRILYIRKYPWAEAGAVELVQPHTEMVSETTHSYLGDYGEGTKRR